MTEQLKQLQDLQAQLHAVNQEFARAGRTLDGMTDLNIERRKKIGSELRAVLARWETVTQQISRALGTDGATGMSGQHTTKADCDEN
jgi:hypothetical protein